MSHPPIATMYALRDAMIAALPFHALKQRVPGERDKFALIVLGGVRDHEVTVHAVLESGVLQVSATVAPYGRVYRAASAEPEAVARELAAQIAELLKPTTRTMTVTFKRVRKPR